MNEDDDFWFYLWHEHCDEEQEKQKCCPNCGSERTYYDKDTELWICLDCDFEWDDMRGKSR